MRLAELTFGSPLFLLGLIPVAGVIGWLVWRRKKTREPGLQFSSGALVGELPRTVWARVAWLPDALRLLALASFVVALARPQALGASGSDDAEGIDIVIALDTSGSMQAADFQPNDRMFVAKKSVAELIKQRTNDRIGLVVFAGEASSWAPLTLDYSLLAQLLEEVEVGMLPDGTAIGSAIGTALNRLRESTATTRVIVLITDGDNNRGNISPKQAAQLAKDLGVRIYTVLIGRGGKVPFPAGKDMFGRPVFQETDIATNPALLEDIAQTTGGAAYKASDKTELDQQLAKILDTLEKTKLEAQTYSAPRDELFPWLLGAGLLFLALEQLLGSTRLWRYP